VSSVQAAAGAEDELVLLELGAIDDDETTDDEGAELLLALLDGRIIIELDALLTEEGAELLATLELLGVLQPIRSLPTATSSNQPSTPLLC